MSRITWGADGHGVKHYLCSYCELEFGPDPDLIHHECDETRPRYQNRDKRGGVIYSQTARSEFAQPTQTGLSHDLQRF